ncbi:MAG TPA: F0F1 ATP synthase subunit [Janthinobacterium sp.]|nr:F0F1 ATP synthase subunit [Janthinobacterium sp.]
MNKDVDEEGCKGAGDERRNGAAPAGAPGMAHQVGVKAARKLKARKKGARGVWFGLGMMGLIGWSVVVPTLAGAALGHWIEAHYPGKHGWTLALLVGGLALGCMNAWHWVAKEERAIREEQEDVDE